MADERVDERGALPSAVWGAPFVLGLLMTLVGLLALSMAVWTSLASIIFLGVMLFISGLIEIGHAFRTWKTGRPLAHFLGGILSAVVGVLLAARPLAGLAAVSLLLAGYFFASGLFRAITSIADRYSQWGWDLLYGISAVILGVVLLAQWPNSALWVVGVLVGIEILFRGTTLMAGGLGLRHVIRARGRATT
jgi:uncharacterized membrane protein HdeD (DUF308 family)